MADSNTTANGKDKSPARKRAAPRTSAAKRTPAKARTAPRAAASTVRKASTSTLKASSTLPKWLTVGASVTGAVLAVGATLFATRKEWLPRAKQVGEWVEDSVHEQLENVATVRAKIASRHDNDGTVTAPRLEPDGADGAFNVGAAAH
jgi:hypothetical protein